MSCKLAVYPGSFDPITNGHVDLIYRSLEIFDKVTVAVAKNPRKSTLFTAEERVEMIREIVQDEPRVDVTSFSVLLVEHIRKLGARTIIRGLRALADFEYEFQFAHMNRRLAREIDSVFMMTSEENFYVSSSLVKEVAAFGGDVSSLVPEIVKRTLAEKFSDGHVEPGRM
ncbi:MAG: pantetheine-phosphate adenylyltransferase [Deltaproteobacteria bacterium]|nr:pantetheine-phosphate adenylyltransferase [Deltaproteobacteria bacterium]